MKLKFLPKPIGTRSHLACIFVSKEGGCDKATPPPRAHIVPGTLSCYPVSYSTQIVKQRLGSSTQLSLAVDRYASGGAGLDWSSGAKPGGTYWAETVISSGTANGTGAAEVWRKPSREQPVKVDSPTAVVPGLAFTDRLCCEGLKWVEGRARE
ncbi:Hypothetical predicted protein [Pelobates cultripes]|uniref:Uncharacterized protein n=1 Tax=Pelobates cultripes TaxID=61616 RepID=A0AAD1R7E6_PELCU|nr:Hypothetical predicted protein [Pelobates cultripes]